MCIHGSKVGSFISIGLLFCVQKHVTTLEFLAVTHPSHLRQLINRSQVKSCELLTSAVNAPQIMLVELLLMPWC